MTGAGSATVAWAPEVNGYLQGVADAPTYRLPGMNVQTQTAELSQNLIEILAPGDVETQKFLAANLGGQLGLSWVMNTDEFHRLLYNDNNTGFTSGLYNSAEWYLGVDTATGTTERQIQGWAPATGNIQYNGPTETVRVTMTGAYGDEEKNTSITPGTIQSGSSEVPGHAASLTVNGVDIAKLQTATLSFENISRLQTGPSRHPLDAVAGNVSTGIDIEAIYDGPEQYELALGGPGATSVQEDVDEVTATLGFDVQGSTVASYDLARVAPDTYDWTDLVNNDADLNESINFNAAGVTASDPTTA